MDNGEGMDETTLEHATDPFFTTKEVGKGTGLGLPMVLGVAEQLGGQLVLKSRKGQGTAAGLLPVAPKMGTTGSTVLADHASPPSRPLTVLVVDDDSLVLTNMAAMLEDLGRQVFEANSARQALAILRRDTRDEPPRSGP